MRIFVRRTGILTVSDTLATENGKADYPIPSEILELTEITYKDAVLSAENFISWEDYLKLTALASGASLPTHFTTRGSTLYLYPPPGESASLTLYGTKKPADLGASNNYPEFDEEFHPYLANYATAQAKIADDEDPSFFLALFEKGILDGRSFASGKRAKRTPTVPYRTV